MELRWLPCVLDAKFGVVMAVRGIYSRGGHIRESGERTFLSGVQWRSSGGSLRANPQKLTTSFEKMHKYFVYTETFNNIFSYECTKHTLQHFQAGQVPPFPCLRAPTDVRSWVDSITLRTGGYILPHKTGRENVVEWPITRPCIAQLCCIGRCVAGFVSDQNRERLGGGGLKWQCIPNCRPV